MVVAKPAHLHSTIGADPTVPSVAAWLIERDPNQRGIGDRNTEGGLVHRLDYETSGVLIAAKTRSAWLALRAAIQDGRVEKSYLVILEGILKDPMAVENFIGSPHRRGVKVRAYDTLPAHGRALPARSLFAPCASSPTLDLTLARVTAHTARRHQVRIHARTIGHPLCGDSLYGSTRALADLVTRSSGPAVPRFFLHAEAATFNHPVSDARLRLVAPTPEFVTETFRAGGSGVLPT